MYNLTLDQFGDAYKDQIDIQFLQEDEDTKLESYEGHRWDATEEHEHVCILAKYFTKLFDEREAAMDQEQIDEEPDTAMQDFIVDEESKKRKGKDMEKDKKKKQRYFSVKMCCSKIMWERIL